MGDQTIPDSNRFLKLEEHWPTDELVHSETGYQKLAHFFYRSSFLRTGFSLDRVECNFRESSSRTVKDEHVKVALVSSPVAGPRKLDADPADLTLERYKKERQLLFRQKVDGQRYLFTPYDFFVSENSEVDNTAVDQPNAKYNPDSWIKWRARELRKALSRNPDIVCFPEFSAPPPLRSVDGLGYRSPAHSDTVLQDYIRKISNEIDDAAHRLGVEYKPFICAGTYHCPTEYYNTALIFPAGSKVGPQEASLLSQKISEDEESLEISLEVPVIHRKMYPARRMGEEARIPARNQFYTYSAFGLQLAVLICSDILDLNQTMHLARISALRPERPEGLHVVLIPCYNVGTTFLSFCQELSFVAACVVVVVNANSDFPEFSSSSVFVCGYSLDRLSNLDSEFKDAVIFSSEDKVLGSHHDTGEKYRVDFVTFDKRMLIKFIAQLRDRALKHVGLEKGTDQDLGM